jgi:hypothetical protein
MAISKKVGKIGTKAGSIKCPNGVFKFCAIVGDGIENENSGKREYKAVLECDIDDAQDFMDAIDDIFEANAGNEEGKLPYQTTDDYDQIPEGKVWIQAKASTTYYNEAKDEETPITINIYNARGKKVQLDDGVGVGDGSEGRLSSGTISFWEAGTKKKKDYGITIYLSGIQLTEFVPYEFDEAPEEMDGSFTGQSDDLEEDEVEEKPRRRRRRG